MGGDFDTPSILRWEYVRVDKDITNVNINAFKTYFTEPELVK